MPGTIDPWDLLIVYLFELRSIEKSKHNPLEKKKIKSKKELIMADTI